MSGTGFTPENWALPIPRFWGDGRREKGEGRNLPVCCARNDMGGGMCLRAGGNNGGGDSMRDKRKEGWVPAFARTTGVVAWNNGGWGDGRFANRPYGRRLRGCSVARFPGSGLLRSE